MRLAASLLALLLTLFLALDPARAESTWTEIRSPHFRVLTDASGRDGRMVANEFEQIRHVFVLRFNKEQIGSGAPLTIVAARDSETFRRLEPALWKSQGTRIAGEFHRGWEKQFALVRLDGWAGNGHEVVFHEYTHSIMHANTHWLPTWLDEGSAEFYAYTRFEGSRTLVGAPSERAGLLQHTLMLMPATTMLEVNERSPILHDDQKIQLFYAEAWAMVHYMLFGPGMDGGQKLNAFVQRLQTGANQQQAFREVFGDPKNFDEGLQQYVRRFTFSAGVLPADPGMDPKTFGERKLTPAEADYELGCFHLGEHDRERGRALIEQALTLDPKLAGAHEELGFLDFQAGLDDDARREWSAALAIDPALPRSLFAMTMSSQSQSTPSPLFASSGQQTPAQLRATQTTLRRITELSPLFAPAYVELALVEWRLHSMQQAYADAQKAEALEPWRAGYHLVTAGILLQGNQPKFAANYSRYVAEHWFGPDHNEAVELWQTVPAAMREPGTPLTLDLPPAATVVHGTLTEMRCESDPGKAHLHITLAPDGPADQKPLTFTSDGRIRIGFSDSFWWGEDHFSPCHHLEGHRAVLAYNPQNPDGSQLLEVEVRDTLPTSAIPPQPAASLPPQPATSSSLQPAPTQP